MQNTSTYSIKNMISMFSFLLIILFFAPHAFAKNVKISIINYTNQELRYIVEEKSINSQIVLPNSVPAGNQTKGGNGIGYVQTIQDDSNAEGVFRIGYDNQHYCEFSYTLDKNTKSWSWFMRPTKWENMNKVSCDVDPDSHKVIVFQEMTNQK